MVTFIRHGSPFWRTRVQEDNGRAASSSHIKDTGLIVGASYSHADTLKADILPARLSQIAPKSPSVPVKMQQNTLPIHQAYASRSLTQRRSYTDFLSHTNNDWNVEGDNDQVIDFDFENYEGDEFGLPSMMSMLKKKDISTSKGLVDLGKKETNSKLVNDGQTISNNISRRESNSVDIAIERPKLNNQVVKKTEGKILRPQYKEILRDPANSLHLIDHPPIAPDALPKEVDVHSARLTRINKFKKILQATSINLTDLRSAAWSGVPEEVRAMTWQLLLGYLPSSSERRVGTLNRKRKEYLDGVRQAFERGGACSTSTGKARGLDEAIWHQISIDVPRTNPRVELYGYEATQRSLERILYVWAIRHPASGYVQGINDLVTPFWQVFLASYITDSDVESGMDPGQLPRAVLDAVEADSFWCLTKLLDGIQDNYIFAQPGIQRQVSALRDLTARIDEPLVKHLESESVEFIQFSFRWMNCLLMREISVKNTIRMWDTYLKSEEQGFSEFHLYVCVAFLVKWSDKLRTMDFQEVMMFLQALPTRDWTEKDVELLLSEAFIWQSLFQGSSSHLRSGTGIKSPNTALKGI
ncbi:GTPase-activating protein gyp1 [Golovinomyces cichoracearum]|uniref:GTPase-activating protein gyp1 n=1 Tax=Golovinomyces cichoracearum TaxID=62708 RepID=A0A420HJY9_9PEZI|nr:GTPase-activating protein gyp1 [Golovinomyces cichoracearum]